RTGCGSNETTALHAELIDYSQ
ncbi:MAG: hypothetical protein QOE49_752, partial [Rhodospirillaceae bacterium]|nr:hypothetical protein [Rhodospirillaceae bacterium]